MIAEARPTQALTEAVDCGGAVSPILDHHYLDGSGKGCFAVVMVVGGAVVVGLVGPGNNPLVDVGGVPMMYVSDGIVEGFCDDTAVDGNKVVDSAVVAGEV
ncbi:hypothetical protein [Nocardia sp. NPDC049526]|uniref:hypothetical protein n=1 Tax=Nocardia sp. NPDC049526 TaxID=3364316 RepID=UPI003790CF14